MDGPRTAVDMRAPPAFDSGPIQHAMHKATKVLQQHIQEALEASRSFDKAYKAMDLQDAEEVLRVKEAERHARACLRRSDCTSLYYDALVEETQMATSHSKALADAVRRGADADAHATDMAMRVVFRAFEAYGVACRVTAHLRARCHVGCSDKQADIHLADLRGLLEDAQDRLSDAEEDAPSP
jgi:hypothetical protein